MITNVLTIGYEGSSVEDLFITLQDAGVDVLIDVREMPLSRKPGLSKTALSLNLPRLTGIAYRHERWLGAPKPVRLALKETGDYKSYFKGFDAYLETQRQSLTELSESLDGTIALMCFERDPDQCHRKSVARMLGEIVGVKPKHLGVRKHANAKGTSLYFGESLSAA